ncbi:PUA-like domain-containing protein [Mycena belliarum]|uniref:PUA-like domain-containing protein n=1 Tax=Mycena belliarum TaxID=1033014 RepID=A0AAD6UJB1_9AGAR|nr:PUA-like domain-containing protein [Mycena belliae]
MSAFRGRQLDRKPGLDPKVHGHIKDVCIFSTYKGRFECSEAGVHAPLSKGIHGSGNSPAFSVVLSGGYEDDSDKGDTFTYTGQGGRSRGERDWSGVQCEDQEWTGENKSLQLSHISGTPVRVVRGHTLHSRYAPAEGYRYDGLYKVTEATRAPGKTRFMTCQFTFERLPDQPPLPNKVLRTKKIIRRPMQIKLEAGDSKLLEAGSSRASGLHKQGPVAGPSRAHAPLIKARTSLERPRALSQLRKTVSPAQRPSEPTQTSLEPTRSLSLPSLKLEESVAGLARVVNPPEQSRTRALAEQLRFKRRRDDGEQEQKYAPFKLSKLI